MKYTIELTDNQKKQMDFMLDMANKHMGFNRKLEMIKTTNIEDTNEYQIGYKTGREDGFAYCRNNTELTDELKQVEYNKGVEDFENLFVHEHDYEQFFEDTYGSKAPDYNLYDLVAKYGAKKVVDDFQKWQEEKKKAEKEIKVGDEVLYGSSKLLVTKITNASICTVDVDGKVDTWKATAGLIKTGRHFDEVEQLLNKLKGE